MVLLATGVVATLWLSTQAIAGSYKLEQLRENNNRLSEQVGQLERAVTKRESPGWLAEHARELGMVPGGTPAKLVVDSDGSVSVVGEPQKVTAPKSEQDQDDSEKSGESSDEGDSGDGDNAADESTTDDSAGSPQDDSSDNDSGEDGSDTQSADAGSSET